MFQLKPIVVQCSNPLLHTGDIEGIDTMEPPEANPNPTSNQPTNSVGTAENIEPFSEETPTQQDDLAEFITFISHVPPGPILCTPQKSTPHNHIRNHWLDNNAKEKCLLGCNLIWAGN
jgi:hypothetical protein